MKTKEYNITSNDLWGGSIFIDTTWLEFFQPLKRFFSSTKTFTPKIWDN